MAAVDDLLAAIEDQLSDRSSDSAVTPASRSATGPTRLATKLQPQREG
jgi:hypothetical protein